MMRPPEENITKTNTLRLRNLLNTVVAFALRFAGHDRGRSIETARFEVAGKQLQILKEVIPSASKVGLLVTRMGTRILRGSPSCGNSAKTWEFRCSCERLRCRADTLLSEDQSILCSPYFQERPADRR